MTFSSGSPWSRLRWPQIVAATLVFGVAVGFAGRATDHVDSEVASWLGVIGAPWLLAAFITGAAVGERRSAVVAGACSQVLAVAVYYALMYRVEYRATAQYAAAMTVGWSAFAAVLGAGMGYVGSLARDASPRLRSAALAVFSGMLVGEGVFGLAVWEAPAARFLVSLELLVGLAAMTMLAPYRQISRVVAMTAVVAFAAATAEFGITELMTAAGWAGGRFGA